MLNINYETHEVTIDGTLIGHLHRFLGSDRWCISPEWHFDDSVFRNEVDAVARLCSYAARMGIYLTEVAAA